MRMFVMFITKQGFEEERGCSKEERNMDEPEDERGYDDGDRS